MDDSRPSMLPGVVWSGFGEPSVRSLSEFPRNKSEQYQYVKEVCPNHSALYIAERLFYGGIG